MVHKLEDVDRGRVIDSVKVEINDNDTLQTLKQRVKSYGRTTISVLQNCIRSKNENNLLEVPTIGKVRKVTIGYGHLLLTANRLSSFDKHMVIFQIKELF